MKKLIKKLSLFFKLPDVKSLFRQDRNGRPCAHCDQPMARKESYLLGNGDEVHVRCWGDYVHANAMKMSQRIKEATRNESQD